MSVLLNNQFVEAVWLLGEYRFDYCLQLKNSIISCIPLGWDNDKLLADGLLGLLVAFAAEIAH